MRWLQCQAISSHVALCSHLLVEERSIVGEGVFLREDVSESDSSAVCIGPQLCLLKRHHQSEHIRLALFSDLVAIHELCELLGLHHHLLLFPLLLVPSRLLLVCRFFLGLRLRLLLRHARLSWLFLLFLHQVLHLLVLNHCLFLLDQLLASLVHV